MPARVELLRLDRRVTARRARRWDDGHRGPRGRWCLFDPGIDFGGRDYDPARTAKIGAGGSARRWYSWGRWLIGTRTAAGLLSRQGDGAETKNCRCKDPY